MEEAVSLIEERANEINQGPLVFKAGDISYEVSPEDLEIVLDPVQIKSRLEAYVDSGLYSCRPPFSGKDPRWLWKALRTSYHLP